MSMIIDFIKKKFSEKPEYLLYAAGGLFFIIFIATNIVTSKLDNNNNRNQQAVNENSISGANKRSNEARGQLDADKGATLSGDKPANDDRLTNARSDEGVGKTRHILDDFNNDSLPIPKNKPILAGPADGGSKEPSIYVRLGDTLRITIHERLDFFAPKDKNQSGSRKDALTTYVSREDLSGDYRVNSDGTISLPLIGVINAADQQSDKIQDVISKQLLKENKNNIRVSISITNRSPVFVTGAVRNPGSYPYRPGMTVMQLIAQAGGHASLPSDSTQVVQYYRETERLGEAKYQLSELIARQAYLTGKRPGSITDKVADLVGKNESKKIISDAKIYFDLKETKRQQEIKQLKAELEANGNEVSLLEERKENYLAQIKVRKKILDEMLGFSRKKLIRQNLVYAAEKELADYEGQYRDFIIDMAKHKRLKLQMTFKLDSLTNDWNIQLNEEVNDIRRKIKSLEAVIKGASQITSIFQDPSFKEYQNKKIEYEILRQTAEGPRTVPISQLSILEPGDILRTKLPSSISN